VSRKNLILDKNEQGFTLIEVLVSVAILAIGVAAIFALVSVSDRTLQNSIERAQLNAQANEIIETLHSDQPNISEYNNKNIGKCGSLSTSKGKDVQRVRLKKWCERMKGESGEAVSLDKRMVRVTKKKIGPREVNIVTVELTSKDGKNTVFTKRVFYAP
jgi:type IV pilus assembly protein PilV